VSSFSALRQPEKAISADSLNKGTYFRVSTFTAFWGHENANFAESCYPLFKGTSLSLSRFSSFLNLKMRFFRDVKPTVQGNIPLYEFIFCILVS